MNRMKKRVGSITRTVALGMLTLAMFACRSAAPQDDADPFASASTADVTFAGGHGASCEDAVIVKGAKNETEGVKAEYEWIAREYPGYQRGSQSLGDCSGTGADVIEITTREGQKLRVYFDISDFFGKY